MRFSNPKNIAAICAASLFGVIVILILDSFTLNYWIKSCIKLTVWGGCVLFACKPHPLSLFKPKMHKSLVWTTMLGVLALSIIMLSAHILLPIFQLDQVQNHIANIGVADNYLLVSLYIICINCTLEELFFRGMCTIKLQENSNRTFATIYSAALFAIYHIPMMSHLFPVYFTIICFVGLFLTGIIFSMLNSKTQNIYNSLIVHACANIAIQ